MCNSLLWSQNSFTTCEWLIYFKILPFSLIQKCTNMTKLLVATSKALTSLGMRFKWKFHIFVGKKCFTSKIFIYIYWKRGLINFEFFRESSSKRGIRYGQKPFQVWDYLNLLEVTMVGRVLWNWICPFFHTSVCLSICLKNFLRLVHYFFSETQHGVRNPCEVKRDNFVKLWH